MSPAINIPSDLTVNHFFSAACIHWSVNALGGKCLPTVRDAEILLQMYNPPCACTICHRQSVALAQQVKYHNNQRTREVTKTEASEISKNFMSSTQQEKGFLLTKCRSYANAILDLWTARPLSERKALWLEVIQQCISIDGKEADTRQNVSGEISAQEYGASGTSTHCLTSTSKLSGKPPARFLNLVFHRVKYLAVGWAPYDTPWLRLPWNTGAFGRLFNRNCVVVQGPKCGEHHRASTQGWSFLLALQTRNIHKGS